MEKWWDVLCNVATGTIKFASHLPAPAATEPHIAVDTEFIADVHALTTQTYTHTHTRARMSAPTTDGC